MLESQLIESPEGFRQDEHQSLGVLVLQPKGALQMEDFVKLAEKVDHYLLNHERLHSVVIHSKDFPGWTNFSALLSHLRFVRQHHEKVEKIALVTDTALADAAKVILDHFIKAELKHFAYSDYSNALAWAQQR